MFAHGGEIGTDDAVDIEAGLSAPTAGDFLLELGHAQVAFSLVVIERYTMVGNETPNRAQRLPLAVSSLPERAP